MTFLNIVLCFAAGLTGGLFGMQVLFWIGKPQAQLTIDLTLREHPRCPKCGISMGVRTLFQNTLQGEASLDGKSVDTNPDF